MVSSWHMRCVTYSDVLAGCQVVAMQLLMCSEYVVSMALQVVETKVEMVNMFYTHPFHVILAMNILMLDIPNNIY